MSQFTPSLCPSYGGYCDNWDKRTDTRLLPVLKKRKSTKNWETFLKKLERSGYGLAFEAFL
jgi:hypothetical protein